MPSPGHDCVGVRGHRGLPQKLSTRGADCKQIPRNPLLDEHASALGKGSIGPLTIRLTPKSQPQPTPEAIKAHDTVLLSVNDAKALAAMICGAGYKNTRLTEIQIEDIRMRTLAIVGADDS